jgi:hypothetical protein
MYHEFLMPYVKLMSIVNKHLILSCGKSFSFGVFISGFGFLVKNFSVCVSIKSLILGNSERSLKYCVFVYRGTEGHCVLGACIWSGKFLRAQERNPKGVTTQGRRRL